MVAISDWLFEEVWSQVGGDQFAIAGLPEPAVTVARDDVVTPVAQHLRDKTENQKRAPPATDNPAHAQIAGGFGVRQTVADQQIGLVHGDAVMLVERGADRRLRRGKPENAAFVVSHQPARAARTQHANAVENEERFVVRESRNLGIPLIA